MERTFCIPAIYWRLRRLAKVLTTAKDAVCCADRNLRASREYRHQLAGEVARSMLAEQGIHLSTDEVRRAVAVSSLLF